MEPQMNVQLREAREDDLPEILEIFNEALINSTATFEPEPQTAGTRREWFRSHGGNYPIIIAELEDRVVGCCSLSTYSRNKGYSKTVELSVYVDKDFRRRGIGRILMNDIIRRAKDLGHHVILSSIAEDNDPSKRLHRGFGFELVGRLREVGWKFSQWQDTNLYELIL